MPTPPVKNDSGGYVFTTALIPQTADGGFQANPTLATGDVKVSKDGGAFANLGTLPSVTPAGGSAVEVTLSQSEINADRVVVQFVDAAGAEWCDQQIVLHTVSHDFDALGTDTDDIQSRLPAALVSGKMDSDATSIGGIANAADVLGSMLRQSVASQADSGSTTTIVDAALTQADDWWNGSFVTCYFGTNEGITRQISDFDAATDTITVSEAFPEAVDSSTFYVIHPGINPPVLDRIEADTQDLQTQIGTAGAGLTDLGGMSTAMKAEVNAEVDTALTDYDPPTHAELVSEINDVQIDIAGLNNLSAAQVNAEVDTALADYDGPTRAEATSDKAEILTVLGTPAGADLATDIAAVKTDTAATLVDTNELQADWADGGRLDLLMDAVKAKTDSLTYTVASVLDVNIQYVNDVQVNGVGTEGDPWGP